MDTGGLRLLSLDGGGIRGLSELLMLERLMRQIQQEAGISTDVELRPCEVFHMICGTSTGGLIAIMLGRLQMKVSQCIETYARLAKNVFGKPISRYRLTGARFEAASLKAAIENIVNEQDQGDSMFDDRPESCKTFVCATATSSTTRPRRLRTYEQDLSAQCDIWEAALATSAAPTFFEKAKICYSGNIIETFVDGALGCNNPAVQLYKEAKEIFPDRQNDCIISLGTGSTPIIGLPRPRFSDKFVPRDIIKALKGIVSDCENVHEEMLEQFRHQPNTYFRFNVSFGLENIGLAEYEKLGDIKGITTHYMEGPERHSLAEAARSLHRSSQNRDAGEVVSMKGKSIQKADAPQVINQILAVDAFDATWIGDRSEKSRSLVVRGSKSHSSAQDQDAFLQSLSVGHSSICSVRKHKAGRYGKTCEWIHQKPAFQRWNTKAGLQLLILIAPIGRGKSTLAKHILEDLQAKMFLNEKVMVLEYFCHDFRGRNTFSKLVQSLLYQLLTRRPHLSQYVPHQYNQRLDGMKNLSPATMWDIYLELLKSDDITTVYCIIDGFDECKEESQRDFWKVIEDVIRVEDLNGESYSSKIRLLITSRPTALAKEIGLATNKIEISKEDVDPDISVYVDHRVNEMVSTQLIPPELSEVVRQRLRTTADGMFLWAAQSLDQLRDFEDGLSLYNITEVLEKVPKDVNDLYERAARRIAEHPKRLERAQIILTILTFASDALSLHALATITTLWCFESKSHAELRQRLDLRFEYTVKKACGSLIRISDNMIHFCHSSARRFLMEEAPKIGLFSFDEAKSHAHLAEICMQYLMLPDSHLLECEEIIFDLELEGDFLTYALKHWHDHLRSSGYALRDLLPVIERFLSPTNLERVIRSVQILAELEDSWLGYPTTSNSPIHVLVYYELYNVLELWIGLPKKACDSFELTSAGLDFDHSVDALNDDLETPLMVASILGFEKIVQLLLDFGADPNATSLEGSSPLHYAVFYGSQEVVRVLVRQSNDIDKQDSQGLSPLHKAPDTGIMIALLEAGANVHITSRDGRTPLHSAAEKSNEGLVEILLARDADPDCLDLDGNTPLHIAACNPVIAVLMKILDYSPNMKLVTTSGHTPLHFAANENLQDAINLLLRHGAEIDYRAERGITAMHVACASSHEEVVDALLDWECDVECKDDAGFTPLLWAIPTRNLSLIQMLLNAGADVNVISREGQTAMTIASDHGYADVISCLLKNGAEPDICPTEFPSKFEARQQRSPIFCALEHGHLGVVGMLMQAGANLGACTPDGLSLLHYAARMGEIDLMEMLLALGLDVNALSMDKSTPLHEAANAESMEAVTLLLEAGASVENRANKDLTPIDLAAMHGNFVMLKCLLNHLGDCPSRQHMLPDILKAAATGGNLEMVNFLLTEIKKKECQILTLASSFHIAAFEGHFEVSKRIMDEGVDVNATGDFGYTAILFAMQNEMLEVANFLLEQGACTRISADDGTSVLHYAAQHGAYQIAHRFLENGSDPLAVGYTKWTPLGLAAANGEPAMVRLLLQYAPKNLGTFDRSRDPFDQACAAGNLQTIQQFLQSDFDPEQPGLDGRSSIQAASLSGKVDVTAFLVDKGVDPSRPDAFGWTPLHMAAISGNVELLLLLIGYGVPLDPQNETGATPLSLALLTRNHKLGDILIGAGASRLVVDKYGLTARDRAAFVTAGYKLSGNKKVNYQPISTLQRRDMQIDFTRSCLERLTCLFMEDLSEKFHLITNLVEGLIYLQEYDLCQTLLLLAVQDSTDRGYKFPAKCCLCSEDIRVKEENLMVCKICSSQLCEDCFDNSEENIRPGELACSQHGCLSICQEEWHHVDPAFDLSPEKEKIVWERWLHEINQKFGFDEPRYHPSTGKRKTGLDGDARSAKIVKLQDSD